MNKDYFDHFNSTVLADKQAVWHPFTPFFGLREPIEITHAQGVELFTAEGKVILDAISSWWVNLHGHANPVIADAISKQAHALEHVIFAGFTHKPAVELAQKLLSQTPWQEGKCFYSDNGSTAVEVALKVALQYWHNQHITKTKIIALEGAYHGDTFGAMAVGEKSPFNAPFDDKLFKVDFLQVPYCTNPLGEEADDQAINNTVVAFEDLISDGQTAAFIFEPLVQGASGMQMYSAKLLSKLVEVCKANNIITIADEVMTGFCRTGTMYASQHLQHFPDIACLSKGITGGFLPLGATLIAEWITQPFRENDLLKTFFHGHSYTANPIACAAANASFDLLLSQDCQQNISRISGYFQTMKTEFDGKPLFKNTRAIGCIWACEYHSTEATGYFNEARNQLNDYFLDMGILLRPLGNVLYIIPPYIITDLQLKTIFNAILSLNLDSNLSKS